MKPSRFHSVVKLKLEPELRSAIEAAADRDRTSMSDFVRRELRAAIARQGVVASPVELRP